MEPNDEVVERQKLVPNDVETEEEAQSQSAPKSAPTPASPAVPNVWFSANDFSPTQKSYRIFDFLSVADQNKRHIQRRNNT